MSTTKEKVNGRWEPNTAITMLGGIATNVLWHLSPDVYFSYNPSPGGGISVFEGDDGSDETAIVIKTAGDDHFLVLNGDWREEYEKAFDEGGAIACLELFIKLREEHESSWSTTKEMSEQELQPDFFGNAIDVESTKEGE
jgi:hypothetical protein